MQAILKYGSKQYLVKEGDIIDIDVIEVEWTVAGY